MSPRGPSAIVNHPEMRRTRPIDRVVGAVWKKMRVVVLRGYGVDHEDYRNSEDWVRYCGLIRRK